MSTRWVNIAPLFDHHQEETAADLKRLYNETCIDSVAFCCTLVPEANPPLNKAAILAERFLKMKELLKDCGIKCGILLQATMGHGWTPDSKSPFQNTVLPDGNSPYVFCPLGDEFLNYIRGQIATLASTEPDFFMLDDDTRLITGRGGCFCPLHLEEFKRRTGKLYTREELASLIKTDLDIAAAYDLMMQDSIIKLAKVIRQEIDNVNPLTHCSFCCCSHDAHHAANIAKALAAPGQEIIVRLNNGRYCSEGTRNIASWLNRTARQLALIPEDVIVLSEPDTCPQNRYSMGATQLNAHISMSLLEGCRGGKIWITRLGVYEPKSGEAYRKIMAKYRNFHAKLLELAPKWKGVRVPKTGTHSPMQYKGNGLDWGSSVLGRFGIAYYNSKHPSSVSMISEDAELLTDEEIIAALSKGAVVDGIGATWLTKRGFAHLLGAKAVKWDKPVPALEVLNDGSQINAKPKTEMLVDVDPKAKVISTYHSRTAALSNETAPISPATIYFENELGGRVVTMAMNIPDALTLGSFYFYNEKRKAMLIDLIKLVSDTPFTYHTGDAELLVKDGTAQDGTRILAIYGVSMDTVEEIPLSIPEPPTSVKRLMADGTWKEIAITQGDSGETVFIDTIAPLDAAVYALN